MTKLIADQKPAKDEEEKKKRRGKQREKMPPQNRNSKAASFRQTAPTKNMAKASISGAKAPSIVPPGNLNDNETITGLWSTNEDKNSWIWINDSNDSANSGWKKLSNASESGIVALTMLASHAKQVGSKVSYRDEDDQMVHEMYVW
jgi:hypothetical protein